MMISENILLRITFSALLFLASLTITSRDIKNETEGDRRAKGIEARGDRKFIRQEFDEAMTIYESAFKHNLSAEYSAVLHLKVGRLYLTLLDYVAAIPHYEATMAIDNELFSTVDVCNYLDALRFSGEKMKAIGLARRYAFRDSYSADQRYQNILHALNYEGGFLPIGTPEFSVRPVDNANTPYSEFWVGVKENEYFYASSKSRFHDPSKKFYHRSNYYSLDENSEYSINKQEHTKGRLLDMIPIALQNGPLSFSRDMTKMVVTQVYYKGGDGIGMSEQGLNTFQTRLYHSDYNKKRKGWSSFKEAFKQKEGYSYSHPFLFNNDRSLLFASDMPGGFGGYDIYVTHWNEQTASWGDPVNLGLQINTEGDEISPCLFNDELIFSSNGHVGFGGYDVYGITYEDGHAVAGSLHHFGYPINTVNNDFSLLHIDENRGYVVSDRNLVNKDDILYFERNVSDKMQNNSLFGISESKAISNGIIDLIKEESRITVPLKESIPNNQFSIHMLSLHFNFDSYKLEDDMLSNLENWRKETDFGRIDTLVIDGYADEIGEEGYNQILSERRANEVGKWIKKLGIKTHLIVEGKGQTSVNLNFQQLLPVQDKELSGQSYKWSLPLEERIQLTQNARRVDIKAITK